VTKRIKVNWPTQANCWLEWGTRKSMSASPPEPNGNYPTQANCWLEWGTRR